MNSLLNKNIISLAIIFNLSTPLAHAIRPTAVSESKKRIRELIHESIELQNVYGARMATVGEVNSSIFQYWNTFKDTETYEILILESPRMKLPHIVHVAGHIKEANKQYKSLTRHFTRDEVVILYFDIRSFYEKRIGYVVDTHKKFMGNLFTGNVARTDNSPYDAVCYLVFELGNKLRRIKESDIEEMRVKVNDIIAREFKGARLANSSA